MAEAIVNAVAHRDYSSNAGTQVMLFSDRLEVWNPGALPPSLTPQLLRGPHESIPRNPLLARPLYLVRYIEMAGTGTLDMIAQCRNAALPEPDFEQRGGQWVVTIWRDWLTADVLGTAGLSERQKTAIVHMRSSGRITNSDYQTLFSVAKRSAHRDLAVLLEKGLINRVGSTGKGTYYVLSKGAIKGPKGPQTRHEPAKGATKGPSRRKPDNRAAKKRTKNGA